MTAVPNTCGYDVSVAQREPEVAELQRLREVRFTLQVGLKIRGHGIEPKAGVGTA